MRDLLAHLSAHRVHLRLEDVAETNPVVAHHVLAWQIRLEREQLAFDVSDLAVAIGDVLGVLAPEAVATVHQEHQKIQAGETDQDAGRSCNGVPLESTL